MNLLLFWILTGCADPYAEAEKADTVEAWEAFLAGNPSATERLKAEVRLEILLIGTAESSKAVADYDAFLKRFPKSKQAKKMKEARSKAHWAAAEEAGTPEAWKKWLDENDFADAAMKKKARGFVAVSEYKDKLGVAEVAVEEVNLAEDPKGPKNGWGFTAEVVNNGDKAIEYLTFDLYFLDASGGRIKGVAYPLVAERWGQFGTPEYMHKPLAPGDKRTFEYTTGEVPENWAKKASLVATNIRFVEAK